MDKERKKAYQRQIQKLLKEVRLKAGLRQKDVARTLGAPQSFVSKYESGEQILDVAQLIDVCDALGISLVELMRKMEEEGF